MNTIENKRILWELLLEAKGFKEGISVETAKELFETILLQIDESDLPLLEKNKLFLKQYTTSIHEINVSPENLVKYRETLFEERVLQNQERFKTTTHTQGHKDLSEIKQLLYKILAKLDEY